MGSSFWVWRGGYVAYAFQEELKERFLWELAVKRFLVP
jgi:hypothetical protein